jgi:aminoglycoside phosphotransferase (APT) family kinase protein
MDAIAALDGPYDRVELERVYLEGLERTWDRPAVWFHGDIAPANLLIQERRLRAVIDFGNMGVGDPACDLAVAWSFFGPGARAAFREARGVDDGAWLRGRSWALWKALILASRLVDGHPRDIARAEQVLEGILVEARQT